MVVAKILAKASFLSVALINTLALVIGLSLLSTLTTQHRAYAGPESIVFDDMEKKHLNMSEGISSLGSS